MILILAGVTIATLTGDNGLLQKAQTASEKNTEASAFEKIQVEVAGSYGVDGKIDVENQLNQNLKRINGLTYNDNEIVLSDDTKKIQTLPATVKLDGYVFEIEENGKVNKKTGIILSNAYLSMAPGDKETLEVTFVGMQEENITWTSDNTTVATVEDGEVTAVSNGTAKIKVTSGDKSEICNVIVASKLVNEAKTGDYVNINIGYADQMDSAKDYRTDNIGIAWRVLSKDTTTGVVKLISTGHPLTFFHPYVENSTTSGETSLTMLKTIEDGAITLQTSSGVRGYQSNGFSTTDIVGLFNNTAIFSGITIPEQSDFNGIDANRDIRTTGKAYWLGEYRGSYYLYRVAKNGNINYHYDDTLGVRPVVILKSGVVVKDGDGKIETPFRLNGITY